MKTFNQIMATALLATSGVGLILLLCVERDWKIADLTQSIFHVVETISALLAIRLAVIITLAIHRAWNSRNKTPIQKNN